MGNASLHLLDPPLHRHKTHHLLLQRLSVAEANDVFCAYEGQNPRVMSRRRLHTLRGYEEFFPPKMLKLSFEMMHTRAKTRKIECLSDTYLYPFFQSS